MNLMRVRIHQALAREAIETIVATSSRREEGVAEVVDAAVDEVEAEAEVEPTIMMMIK